MEKKQKYIKNLDEKIFFICYIKPCYKSEISTLLYGEESNKKDTAYSALAGKDSGRLEDLRKRGWLRRIKTPGYLPIWWNRGKEDGRTWRSKYYESTSKPMLEKIKSKIDLSDFELSVLENIFNSRVFREYICTSKVLFDFLLKEDIISPVDFILIQIEYFSIIYLKTKYLSSIGRLITNKESYDVFTKSLKEAIEKQDIEKYKNKIKRNFPLIYEDFSRIISSKQLSKKLEGLEYILFIPTKLLEKIKGISFYGFIEMIFSSINDEVMGLDQNVKKFWPKIAFNVDNIAFEKVGNSKN